MIKYRAYETKCASLTVDKIIMKANNFFHHRIGS